MPSPVMFRFEGGRELEATLNALGTDIARKIGRTAVNDAAEPILAEMKAGAPQKSGALEQAFGSQVRVRRDKGNAENFVEGRIGVRRAKPDDYRVTKAGRKIKGSAPSGYGRFDEFGTSRQAPKGWMRRAWDIAGAQRALGRIIAGLQQGIARVGRRGRPRGS